MCAVAGVGNVYLLVSAHRDSRYYVVGDGWREGRFSVIQRLGIHNMNIVLALGHLKAVGNVRAPTAIPRAFEVGVAIIDVLRAHSYANFIGKILRALVIICINFTVSLVPDAENNVAIARVKVVDVH